MAEIDNDVAEYFQCLAGTENDLNHILSTFVDSEHEIKIFVTHVTSSSPI